MQFSSKIDGQQAGCLVRGWCAAAEAAGAELPAAIRSRLLPAMAWETEKFLDAVIHGEGIYRPAEACKEKWRQQCLTLLRPGREREDLLAAVLAASDDVTAAYDARTTGYKGTTLTPPPAPRGLTVEVESGTVSLVWKTAGHRVALTWAPQWWQLRIDQLAGDEPSYRVKAAAAHVPGLIPEIE